jgi:hypothetical protein
MYKYRFFPQQRIFYVFQKFDELRQNFIRSILRDNSIFSLGLRSPALSSVTEKPEQGVCTTSLDRVHRIHRYVTQSWTEFIESIGMLHISGQSLQNPSVCYTKLNRVHRINRYVTQSRTKFTETISILHISAQGSQNPSICYTKLDRVQRINPYVTQSWTEFTETISMLHISSQR